MFGISCFVTIPNQSRVSTIYNQNNDLHVLGQKFIFIIKYICVAYSL